MAREVIERVPGRHTVHAIEKLEKALSHEYGVLDEKTGRTESESFSTLAEAVERAEEIAKER
jgi:hypothetical protein